MEYYVYAHRFVGNTTPFYIGMGHGKRAWHNSLQSRGKIWTQTVEHGGPYDVVLIYEALTLEDALALEKYQIALWGRLVDNTGCLINISRGGRTVTLVKDSVLRRAQTLRKTVSNPEYRKLQSEKIKAKWAEPGYRERLKQSHANGVCKTEEYRVGQSEKAKKRWEGKPEEYKRWLENNARAIRSRKQSVTRLRGTDGRFIKS